MKWVTRVNARVDRVACPWLIKRFIDPEAEFLYVERDRVLEVAEKERAHSFDANGATFGHRDGKCTFETMVARRQLDDPALQRLALIVHRADIPQDLSVIPEAAGLRAIAEETATPCRDDHRKLEMLFPVYDAMYAYFQVVSEGSQ